MSHMKTKQRKGQRVLGWRYASDEVVWEGGGI